MQTVMTQCELWADNADMEQQEEVIDYSFRTEENLSKVAEDSKPYN